MSSNEFCKHLSNGFRIFVNNNKITWAPCCYWTGNPMPFQNHRNDRKIINISTPWAHQECGKCKDEEQFKRGYRKAGLDIIPKGLPDTKAAWLDIQADITCNGGCLICGPWSSSFWQGELSKYNEFQIKKSNNNFVPVVKEIFSSIDTSELRLIQFLGGEPFLSDIDTLALPLVANPSKCTIKYTTNGSIYPKEPRLEQWEQFESVMLNFSIDGIGNQFEYLRYPLKWDVVNKNIKRLIQDTSEKIKFHINHTITPFNILYYQEFLNWVEETFPKHRFIGIHAHPAYGVMSISHCSQPLRNAIKEKYGINSNLNIMLNQNPKQDSTEFWKYVLTWDHRRSLDWKVVFPNLIGILDSNA